MLKNRRTEKLEIISLPFALTCLILSSTGYGQESAPTSEVTHTIVVSATDQCNPKTLATPVPTGTTVIVFQLDNKACEFIASPSGEMAPYVRLSGGKKEYCAPTSVSTYQTKTMPTQSRDLQYFHSVRKVSEPNDTLGNTNFGVLKTQ